VPLPPSIPTAIDEQSLVAVVERGPLDRVLREVDLGNAIGDPVQQRDALGVRLIIVVAPSTSASACSSFTSSRSSRSGRSG
jgi:hypothetical protein